MSDGKQPGSFPFSHILAGLFLVLLLVALPAGAQFTQYLPPGAFQDEETMDSILEAAMADARWTAGPFLIDPWFSLREVSHDDNVGNRPREPIVSDLLVKVGAGLRAYLPVSSDLVLTGHVLPEYLWWRDLSDRRRVAGRFGVGLFGSAGPADLEISVQRLDDTRFFSREFEDRVDFEEEIAVAGVEVGIGRGLAAFGRAEFHNYRFEEQDVGVDPPVGVLDRDEIVGRAGVRFRPRDNLTLGLGFEVSEVEFQSSDPRRSNDGSAPVFELSYLGPRLSFATDLAWCSIEAANGLEFPEVDELFGNVAASWRLAGPLYFELMGSRNLIYSFLDDYAYFQDESLMAGLRVSLGARAGLRVRYEDGRDEYVGFRSSGAAFRLDDFRGVHGEFQFAIGPATLLISASETEYDSNLAVHDRTVTTVSTGLIFGRRNQSPWG